MPTRNVVLTDHQADLVERLVASGRCQNASEVLREAARIGADDIDAGRFRSFESPAARNRHLPAIANGAIACQPAAARSK